MLHSRRERLLGGIAWTNARRIGDVYLTRWLWNLLELATVVDRHVPLGKGTNRPADIETSSSHAAR